MKRTLCILAIGSLSTILTAQERTIPERIARGENPVYLSVIREIVEPSLQDLVRASSLIVEGKVAPVGTYLSEDQRRVYTDYRITPALVIFQRKVQTLPTPGQQSLILKVRGGRLSIDGVEVIYVDENLETWKPDAHVILFLTASKTEPEKYELVFEVGGGFEVTGERIRPLLKGDGMMQSERGLTKSDFLNRVYRALDHVADAGAAHSLRQ